MSTASIRMLQSATGPATPPSGYSTLWAKTDDEFYVTKDTGDVERLRGATGPSGVSGSSGTSGLTPLGLSAKNIELSASDFGGWDGTYSYATVTFTQPFSNTDYSIDLQFTEDPATEKTIGFPQVGYGAGTFIENKTASGFTIKWEDNIPTFTNAKVYVQAIALGETAVSGTSGTSGIDGAGGATGYFGGFYSTVDQPISVINTPQKITLSDTSIAREITQSGGTVTISKAGYYIAEVNALVANSSGSAEDVIFWIKYNGSDFPNSTHRMTIAARKSAGVPTERLVSFSFLGQAVNDGDTVEIYWQGTSTDLSLDYQAGAGFPNSASAWIQISQVAYNGNDGTSGSSGTSGVSGSSGTSGSSGSSGTSGSAGAAGSSGTSGITPVGATAGLVAGTGTDSMRSDLTTLIPTASGLESIAIGAGASASTEYGIAIGSAANTGDNLTNVSSIAIGKGAAARFGSVAISGSALGLRSFAFMGDVNGGATGGIALGINTLAQNCGGIAIGLYSTSGAADAIAIGKSSAGGASSIALGNGACNTEQTSIAIGSSATNNCLNAIAIGTQATTDWNDAVAIGVQAKGYYKSIAIGNQSITCGDEAIAIGGNSQTTGAYGVSLGISAQTSGSEAIGIGFAANAGGGCGIAIGKGSIASSGRAIAIGENACGNAANTVNIGWQARGVGSESVAIGYNARGSGSGAIIAIGYDAFGGGNNAISIGASTTANSGNRPIAIGNQANVTGNYASGIGYQATVSHDCAVVLGCAISSVAANHTHIENLYIKSSPTYADQSAAVLAGLTGGQVYKTATGDLKIVY